MSNVDTIVKVPVYEVDGEDQGGLDRPVIIVESHWNVDRFVVLVVDGKKWTVAADDLESAIRRTTGD